jgi:hypothetical protein
VKQGLSREQHDAIVTEQYRSKFEFDGLGKYATGLSQNTVIGNTKLGSGIPSEDTLNVVFLYNDTVS